MKSMKKLRIMESGQAAQRTCPGLSYYCFFFLGVVALGSLYVEATLEPNVVNISFEDCAYGPSGLSCR